MLPIHKIYFDRGCVAMKTTTQFKYSGQLASY